MGGINMADTANPTPHTKQDMAANLALTDAEGETLSAEILRLASGKITLTTLLYLIQLLPSYLPAGFAATVKANDSAPQGGKKIVEYDYDEASMSPGSSQASSSASSSTSQSSRSTDTLSLRPATPQTQDTPKTHKKNDGDQDKTEFRTVVASKRRRDPETPKMDSEENSPPAKTAALLNNAPNLKVNPDPHIPTPAAATTTTTAKTIPFTELKVRIPPIMLHRKADYKIVKRDLMLAGIKISEAKDIRDYIRLELSSSNDFRRATRMLSETNILFHCYALAQEKTFKAVVTGIPLDYTEDQAIKILKSAGYPAIRAQRMKQGGQRTPIPQMLIDLAKTPNGREFFQEKKFDDLNIVVVTRPERQISLTLQS